MSKTLELVSVLPSLMLRTEIAGLIPVVLGAGGEHRTPFFCSHFWNKLQDATEQTSYSTLEEERLGSTSHHIKHFLSTVPFEDATSCVDNAISSATADDAVLMAHVAEQIAKMPQCFDEMLTRSEASS